MVIPLRRALDAWRAAQRRLDRMPEDSFGREELEDLVERLRREYQALYSEVYGEPKPPPDEDRPKR